VILLVRRDGATPYSRAGQPTPGQPTWPASPPPATYGLTDHGFAPDQYGVPVAARVPPSYPYPMASGAAAIYPATAPGSEPTVVEPPGDASDPDPKETTMTPSTGTDPTLALPRPEAGYEDPVHRPLSSYEPPYQPPVLPPTQPYAYEPPPPKPPRQRSYLGILTVSVVLVAMGVLALIDVSGWQVPATSYLLTALGIVAAGLIVGAWYGRSRGLIALGIVLGLALGPATVIDVVTDGTWEWNTADDVRLGPQTAAELQPEYDFGAGKVTLDLTDLASPTADLATRIEVGAGEVVVLVPPGMDAHVDAQTGVGDVEVLGRHTSGFGSHQEVTDLGRDGAGGGELDLEIELGMGRVEVRRAAA
jgi:hypothetical protein